MEFKDDAQAVFESAIKKGILSRNEEDKNYAGNFMYMYSAHEVDYFKHKLTRKYGHDKTSIIEATNF